MDIINNLPAHVHVFLNTCHCLCITYMFTHRYKDFVAFLNTNAFSIIFKCFCVQCNRRSSCNLHIVLYTVYLLGSVRFIKGTKSRCSAFIEIKLSFVFVLKSGMFPWD